jgi:hypothetical protein
VPPQELYDRDGFQSLANAIAGLAKAEAVTTEAKAADDHDAVESLWKDD